MPARSKMEQQNEYRREEQVTTSNFNRDGAVKLAQNMWRDFGPLIVGALVLILVLVGGWTLFKRSQSGAEPQDVVLDTQTTGTDVVLPESNINLSATPTPTPQGGDSASPSPSPTASPTPTPTATSSALAQGGTSGTKGGSQPQVSTGSAMTKGGQLPQTGPEMFILAGSGAALASGFYLLRRNK